MQHIKRWMVLVLIIIAGLLLPACSAKPATSSKIEPARVEPIEGTDLKRVVLTLEAAERLDLRTAPVREELVVRTRRVAGEVVALLDAKAGGLSQVRVRVRLIASDLNQVDRGQPALVRLLDDEDDGEDEDDGLEAEVDEEANGDDPDDSGAGEGTLYYVVANADQSLVPGQRVWARLALVGSEAQRKVVPYSAVLYDRDGKTWVYTNPEPLVFVRHPVSIDYIEGDLAVLLEGPPAGTQVVMVGVAELFGAETGVGK